MVDPKLPGGPPTMFIAGNDAGAKQEVTDILTDFGWETMDAGGIEGARLLEPMCWLWVSTGFKTGQWMQAFKMLRQS
jgi:predicted dinucleotide-binding enzyme